MVAILEIVVYGAASTPMVLTLHRYVATLGYWRNQALSLDAVSMTAQTQTARSIGHPTKAIVSTMPAIVKISPVQNFPASNLYVYSHVQNAKRTANSTAAVFDFDPTALTECGRLLAEGAPSFGGGGESGYDGVTSDGRGVGCRDSGGNGGAGSLSAMTPSCVRPCNKAMMKDRRGPGQGHRA